MNKRPFIACLGVAVALAAIADSASAAILEESAHYGSISSPLAIGSTASLSLPQFATSLGTLTGVTIELYSYDTISSVVFNATGQSAAFSGATATMPVTVTTALDAFDVLTTSAQGTAGPYASLSSAPFGLSVAGSISIPRQTASFSAGDLDFYQGAGVLPISVTVANSVGAYSGNGGSSLFFGGNGFSYGSVEVDYSYSPLIGEPVPEPGTLCAGLAVMSICGVEIARRLRRTSSRPLSLP